MTSQPSHLWIVSAQPPTASELTSLELPALIGLVDADRRLRGPYAAAGQLARLLAPTLVGTAPEVAARHDIELLAVAPDLAGIIPLRRATRTARMAPRNRTRFYPGTRTTRLAHGLTEFVHDVPALRQGPHTVAVTNLDDADMTDVEFVAILLRRTDPRRCRVVVHSRGTALPDPLATVLEQHARQLADPHPHSPDRPGRDAEADGAVAYVASDGTSRDPAQLVAYLAEAPERRAVLHDARADELEARNDPSLRLGAIPYHRERGSDPTGVGAASLLEAIEHCVLEGFYHAVIELAARCFGVLDWKTRPADCWLVTAKVTTALTALNRPEEAEEYYDQACAATTSPSVHLQSAYGRAMLYTRFYSGSRRNHHKAKAWVNTAITISSLLPESDRRAFNMAFNENGLALVEMHLGDLSEARRLVDTGIARLHAEGPALADSQHHLVLAYNRAQLLAATGALEEALNAYDDVITGDPHHSEYYFERASLLRKLGRHQEALADYAMAIEQSAPYPEPHFNRADLAAELGDLTTAMTELSYVLELDPAFATAYTRRASLLLNAGHVADAIADADRGLALRPDDAQLHCIRGLAALEHGQPEEAKASFDRAIALQPHLVPALANRAVLRFENGDTDGAIDDLTIALESDDNPALLENRAMAYEKAGRLEHAVADCERALTHPDADHESLTELLRRCKTGALVMA
jgi:tetratricopeptide (TPR) repeat protein